VVGLVASLAGVTRLPAAAVVEALGPVLAAAVGLAAAALATTSVRHPRQRLAFLLVGALVGVFLSPVVPGYLSTLAFLTPFLAALAVLAMAAGRRSNAPTLAAGVLLVAAGLSHPLFLALAGGVSLGVAAALLPAARAARSRGDPLRETMLGRLTLAWTVALPIIWLSLAASGAATRSGGGVDTSRDAVLRRTHLGPLLKASYLRKLRHDVPWWRAAPAIGMAMTALPLWPAWQEGPEHAADDPVQRERTAAFWGAMGIWLVITLGGLALLITGVAAAPGQRLIIVCLPLPILAGLGLAAVRLRSSALTVAAIALGAALFAVTIGSAWVSNQPLATSTQLEQARAVGSALSTTKQTTPLIVVVDDRSDKPALFITRYGNEFRGVVPAARVPDVHLFVGTPNDLLARRVTLTGQAEHDRLALGYWAKIRPLLHRGPLAIVAEGFDAPAYRSTVALPGSTRVAPGVVALPGFGLPSAPAPGLAPSLSEPGAGPLPPWTPVWFGPALLAGLAGLGWPWARLALPTARAADTAALAPAFGAAALSIASVAVDAVGLRLSGAGAKVALALALLGWAGLVTRRRRRGPASDAGGAGDVVHAAEATLDHGASG
jgi:hypothetical protein